MPGLNIGYLPQEPQLNPEQTVRESVEEGMGGVLAAKKRLDEVYVEYGARGRRLRQARRRTGRARGHHLVGRLRQRRAPARDRRRRAAPAGRGTPSSATCPAARSAASRCAACCCPSPTCCCSTSRPTTWTPSPSTGWSSSCSASPAPSSPSPTIATSSTTPPSGSSNSTAAAAFRTRATTPTWLQQKEARLEQEQKTEDARTKAMKKELEWVRSNPKGRQAKSKARLARFEELSRLRLPEAQRDQRDLHPRGRPPGP